MLCFRFEYICKGNYKYEILGVLCNFYFQRYRFCKKMTNFGSK